MSVVPRLRVRLYTLPADARQYAALPEPFVLWRGGVLHGAHIA